MCFAPAISEQYLCTSYDCNGLVLVYTFVHANSVGVVSLSCKYCTFVIYTIMPLVMPFVSAISEQYLCTGYDCILWYHWFGRVSSQSGVSVGYCTSYHTVMA